MADSGISVRPLDAAAADALVDAFCVPEWNKTPDQYARYLEQHLAGTISCLVAWQDEKLAGYVTIVWEPDNDRYPETIPEIRDLNVLAAFRRRGVATTLLDEAERLVAERSPTVRIGVGLHPGYNAAQRLYVQRGYVPDGRGVTYDEHPVVEGQRVMMDDSLVLHLAKDLTNSPDGPPG